MRALAILGMMALSCAGCAMEAGESGDGAGAEEETHEAAAAAHSFTSAAGSEGQRVYATSGAASTQTWVNLGVGTYHLVFDSDNDENDCELAGSVTVNVAP
jgi:hypothetical protein